jgi:beta-RFAP synthase
MLAKLSGRGQRSGVGLHGFARGGFIVDGGRRGGTELPPLLARLEFPREWSILIVIPGEAPGLHGPSEVNAFAQLPPIADTVTDHLCRLVLLGLMPAVLEADLETFGQTLSELQAHVGECFAPAQGGSYAREDSEAIVASLRKAGLHGVGQSSWGPALYGFSCDDEERRRQILRQIAEQFQLAPGSVFWTRADSHGANVSMPAS